jgi:menaquinone-dependent protoporphyrinogen IX oxidase
MRKILIAFGSRYGSTKEISERISEILNNQELETQLLNLRTVKQKIWPSLNNFDGILVGSGIMMGAWTKEGKRFLKLIQSKNIIKPMGVFVSCGEAMNPNNVPIAKDKYLVKVLEKFGVKASLYEAFGGVFDLSEESKLGSITKKIVLAGSKEDATIKPGQINDGRDWAQIEKFAIEFSNLVKKT